MHTGSIKGNYMNNIDLSTDVKNFFEDYDLPSLDDLNLAEEISNTFKQLKELHDEAYNIDERLEFDDMLLDEYYANLNSLSMIEFFNDQDDMENIERAYLKTIETALRLAKVIHPISGFGLDRLQKAYELIDTFQQKYHPLVTSITSENIDFFADFLSQKDYDEVYYNQKKAIGALRLKGTNTCAAGIMVYRTENSSGENSPVIAVDHMFVHKDFRSLGTANILIAALVRPILYNPNAKVTLSYIPDDVNDDDDEYTKTIKKGIDITCEFLSSWSFNFTMNFNRTFYLAFKDIRETKFTDISESGIKSLKELGDTAESVINAFVKSKQDATLNDIETTPFEYFDKEASCVYMENDEIISLLLCHKYKDKDYVLNHIITCSKNDNISILKLLKHLYNVCKERNDLESILSGETKTDEGYNFLQDIAPNTKFVLVYDGILSPLSPDETITSDKWAELKREAKEKDIYSGIHKNSFSITDDNENDKTFENLMNSIF